MIRLGCAVILNTLQCGGLRPPAVNFCCSEPSILELCHFAIDRLSTRLLFHSAKQKRDRETEARSPCSWSQVSDCCLFVERTWDRGLRLS